MSVENLSPRMRKALRDGKQLIYFADLWKSVLNDKIDLQADFEASVLQSNMDFTTKEGFARLAIEEAAYNISQIASNANATLSYTNVLVVGTPHRYAVQTVVLASGRNLSKLTTSVDATALGATGYIRVMIFRGSVPHYSKANDLFQYMTDNLVVSLRTSVAAGYVGTKEIACDVDLPAGTYTLMATGTNGLLCRYQNTDVYAGGSMSTLSIPWNWPTLYCTWTEDVGDLYFALELSGYKSSGSFTSRTLDLGKVPANTGFFQQAADVPTGTTLTTTLYGSTTGLFAGEETTYADIEDGWVAPAGVRYWRIKNDFSANAALDQSPFVDMVELYYPDDRVRFRQKGHALFNVDPDILREFEPLLVPGSFSPSEIKPIERISSLGTFPIEISDATKGDRIQRIVSDSPLKNFRAALYLGADVPGFTESDLFRVCIGIVEAADVAPKYRGDSYRLSLTIKNPVTDLKRKAPLPDQTGLLNFEAISINEDSHVIDAAIRIMRAYSRIPARYINIESFHQGRLTAGGGAPAPEAHVIRRSNTAATYSDETAAPDTRIKSPTEIVKLLAPLMVIADGYIAIDESSRIKYVPHDTTGAYEATWADESMREEATGADAFIETVGKYLLGYGDFLYNMTYCACEWNGSGDKWEDFMQTYGDIDVDSTDEFAPGADQYINVMEANMIEVSKWLGPESTYNGETLAQAIAARLTDRFSYPPVRIQGAVLPLSQYERGVGGVVRIWSKEFVKFKRRGIALSESLRFMITKMVYDQNKNRMVFDLLELT